jgi:hypothetical protein
MGSTGKLSRFGKSVTRNSHPPLEETVRNDVSKV